mmetsp:Transcript_81387/g.119198  ORF Transcript_81387/g.119198 Transcript_81387/m.119198 type:complete len:223 (-) Transcript_81387:672-1340(-)
MAVPAAATRAIAVLTTSGSDLKGAARCALESCSLSLEAMEHRDSAEPFRERAAPVVDVPALLVEHMEFVLPERFIVFLTIFTVTISLTILKPATTASPFSSRVACSASAASSSSAMIASVAFLASFMSPSPISFLCTFTTKVSSASASSCAATSSAVGPSTTLSAAMPANPSCVTRSRWSGGTAERPSTSLANRFALFTMSSLLHLSSLRWPTMAMIQARYV